METSPPSPVDMLKTLGQIPESAFSAWERGFIADQRRNLTRGSLSEKQYTRLTEIYTERCVTTTAQTPDPEQPPPGEYCPLCHDVGMVKQPIPAQYADIVPTPQPFYARCRCVNDNPVIRYRVGMRAKHKASGRV